MTIEQVIALVVTGLFIWRIMSLDSTAQALIQQLRNEPRAKIIVIDKPILQSAEEDKVT